MASSPEARPPDPSLADHARLAIDSANDAFISIDTSGVIVDWNRAAEVTLGWVREEVLRRRLVDLVVPERFREAHLKGIRRYLETGEGPVLHRTLDLPALRKGGEEFPAELTIWPSEVAGEVRFNAFIRDVSDRVRLRTHLGILQRVTAAGNATHDDVEPVVRRTLDEVVTLTRWPVGHAYLVQGESGVLSPTSWWAGGTTRFGRFVAATESTTFRVGRGLPGRVAATGEPAWIRDIRDDTNFPRHAVATDEGLLAAFAFPVVSGDEVVAVLEFLAEEPTEPDVELLGLMRNLGVQLGRAFERVSHQRRLAETAESRNRLASIVSHEMRGPVAAISSFAQLLRADWAELEESEKLGIVDAVNRQSSRLSSLVDDLLTTSRLEAGVIRPRPETLDLSELVPRTLRDFGHEDVTADLGTHAHVLADPDHVTRIIANLVSNAKKYGAPPVVVQTEEVVDGVELRVTDRGPGVPEQFVPELFARFSRPEAGEGGSGLGLSIVRGLAESNGGRAWYEPASGGGSCFVVLLPPAGGVTEAPST